MAELEMVDLINKSQDKEDTGYGSVRRNRSTTPDNERAFQAKPGELFLLTKRMIILIILSNISGFLFGYDTGIVSGSMLALKEVFHLTYVWQELIISITIVTAALSAAMAGPITDNFGRKRVVLCASFFYTLGAVTMGFASDKVWLLIGRAIIGTGIGFSSMATPIYISEASPKVYRGAFTAGFNMLIATGQMIAAITAALFFPNRKTGWRYMLGLAAIPALIQFVGFFFLPESPRYLVNKNKGEKAKRVLVKLRPTGYDVDKELDLIKVGHQEALKAAETKGGNANIFCEMVRYGVTRRALIIGGGLQMIQQLIGINTVLYYMATIVQMAGIENPLIAVWVAAGIASINAVGSLVGTLLVDSWGRRRLTLLSLFGVLVSLIILAIGFQVISATSPAVDVYIPPPIDEAASECYKQTRCSSCTLHQNCGFCYVAPSSSQLLAVNGSCLPTRLGYGEKSLYGPCHDVHNLTGHTWAYSLCPSHYSWIAIVGLVAYVVTFAPGMGPMPWTVNAEIYPTWSRSTGAAFSTTVNWIFNLVISMTFLSLTLVITRAGTFWLYAGIAFVGLIFFYKFQPETKEKSLEEMEELFSKPWFSL